MLYTNMVVEWILTAVYEILWIPVQGVLALISYFSDIIDFLATGLIERMLFGQEMDIFDFQGIPATFWAFCIVAVGIWFFLFIIQVISWHFVDTNNDQETSWGARIVNSLKHSTAAIVFIFAIPIAIWMFCKLFKWLAMLIALAFGTQDVNLADMLYNIGNPNWDGTINNVPGDYSSPSGIAQWNMLVQIVGVAFMFLAILLLGINLLSNTFEIFFLFLCSPFYAMIMAADNGERMRNWKNDMLARGLINSCTTLIYYTFIYGLIIVNGSLAGFEGYQKMLIMLLITISGAIFVVKADKLVARFIGESVGIGSAVENLGMVMSGLAISGAMVKGAKSGLFGKPKAEGNARSLGGSSSDSGIKDFSTDGLHVGKAAAQNFSAQRQKYSKTGGLFGAFSKTMNITGRAAGTTWNGIRAINSPLHRDKFKASMSGIGDSIKTGAKNVGGVATVLVGARYDEKVATRQNNFNNKNQKNIDKSYEKFYQKNENRKNTYINKIENMNNPKKVGKFTNKLNKKIEKINQKQIKTREKFVSKDKIDEINNKYKTNNQKENNSK